MTTVQWLQEALSLTFEQEMKFEGLFQQAKEMEKQQQDEFAIEFAEWLANSYYSYNFGIKMFEHRNKEIYKTTKELLEIYKKEKGL
jgi:hypothetical protein